MMPRGVGGAHLGNGSARIEMTAQLNGALREPLSAALSQSLLLPAAAALLGVCAALFMIGSVPAPVVGASLPRGRCDADNSYAW
ncbi:MAG: hypothetical protein AB7G47_17035 [Mycolicibacterium sp.]|uniref:hypothetical protein n=1 Tax=Mycolicibacterium sp. TaxID=2320850 RepID=UPI003D098B52